MNILIFGPNGSGKGTQGNLIKQKYNLAHIESGAIFREHIGGGTELGKKAKAYIDRGDLVPDDITIPMVLETLKTKGKDGWLLDGFPRNMVQAEKLWDALQKEGLKLDYVVEILLPREVAKNRIMGRRLCKENNNHPNNIFIDAMCIPKGCQNKEGAEAFINFLCRPDIALKNFEYITYSTPNEAARELIEDESIRNSKIAFPEPEDLVNCETFRFLGDKYDAIYNQLWREVKSK